MIALSFVDVSIVSLVLFAAVPALASFES